MSQAHRFSKYWRNLPVEYALSNIKYLQQNYKKYPIVYPSESQINLGEDIVITINKYDDKTLYMINGLYSPDLDKELKYLWKLCDGTLSPAEKISHWCTENARVFVQTAGYATLVAAIVGLGLGVHSCTKKIKDKKEQYVQKRIDAAIQEYEASKTINYQDTINQKTR
ncbi:MAG: hypothetical protein II238_04325 [Alphaproteobacteria bacterium]|nr:hypothetical protein [Alphaproteobacteria bacterium]